MTQAEWPERLVRVIAGEIRRYRQERNLSAQQLANRCAELGAPIRRSVLANLESGRRATLSVPELFVLSQALNVVPIMLIFPLGHLETEEIAPGQSIGTWDGARWFTGEVGLAGDLDETLGLFRRHQRLVDSYPVVQRGLAEQGARTDRTDARNREGVELYRDALKVTVEELQELRSVMRKRDLMPPPLPPELTHIEAGEPA